jgi:hypothetical protein
MKLKQFQHTRLFHDIEENLIVYIYITITYQQF